MGKVKEVSLSIIPCLKLFPLTELPVSEMGGHSFGRGKPNLKKWRGKRYRNGLKRKSRRELVSRIGVGKYSRKDS